MATTIVATVRRRASFTDIVRVYLWFCSLTGAALSMSESCATWTTGGPRRLS